jgi:phosphate transport system permease protein
VASSVEALRAGGGGGAGPRPPPPVVSKARTDRRILIDRLAARLVVAGGLLIIAAILAILFVILVEIYPLFKAPVAEWMKAHRLAAAGPEEGLRAGSLGVDEYREVASGVTGAEVHFLNLRTGAPWPAVPVPGLHAARIVSVDATGKDRFTLGTSDGRVIPLQVQFDAQFKDGVRTIVPRAVFGPPSLLDPSAKRPILRVAHAAPKEGPITVAQLGPRDLVVQTVIEKKGLIGGGTREESVAPLSVDVDGDVTAMKLDGRGEDLVLGTSRGQIVRYSLRDRAAPTLAEPPEASVGAGGPITAMEFLIGDRTLVVGDGAGRVSSWQVLPPPQGGAPRLTRIYEFAKHDAPIVALSASKRDKGFVSGDAQGGVHLNYGTSGATLLSLRAPGGSVQSLAFAPKADGVVVADGQGSVGQWRVDNPHPEVTLRTLFGKVWYEGYSAPDYVWQSTGGTDDFEAKFSLTPLIYGTLKGTTYALMFAIPLALLGALYVSEFMHPDIKAYVKPVVEIMAALPSVVLGFLAGLWLAPLLERLVPGLAVLPFVETACILAALLCWRAFPQSIRGRVRPGAEVALLIPVIVAGAGIAFWLGGLLELRLLGGDYRGWLLSTLGLTYDQRNSVVVGVAMGFAVIPIIFTIAEDSLANVPQHLRAGSLALGANRWQTAVRIVLPTASPGIFSAIMIGFGRAVGETMIVLMATGNTPVMDWSIFNGFRALSANIAVELPEAPEGGTLFRVLFLAAFLLFCLTFAVNTAAEVVRLRLRQKFRYL